MGLVYSILIGLAAGFLAGQLTKGSGFGWIGNLIVGALGALLGNFVFGLLGLSTLLWPWFLRLRPISERPLFRLRTLAHILLAAVRRPRSAQS